ncbi:hypothetical protein [Cohnella cholangitidis]|uniref:Uncharacterized protein n=1 Tax=Cohnella cholangitidis TaxID=2598458 RepID=A0A7G5C5F9_9BACL|nr:hypothetical protein [Cohnella cholangitidis]QMV44443.1 hypothetical protein FPL14_27205 [Cohnella cholangitidis]
MSTIIPIQVTLQAANASDYRQLVQDLAGTMAGGQVQQAAPVQAPVQPAPSQPAYAAPVQPIPEPYATPAQQPYAAPAPSAVPTAPPVQQQPVQQAVPQGVPTAAPQYDQQQLAVAATALMEAGHNITALLQQFGVQALTQLPPERYGGFATVLRSLGAKI